MTSGTREQIRQQRQLDLMLALGELVAVTDPETGEVHYMATQALADMAEGRCGTRLTTSAGPRHAKEARRGWRLRAVMVVMASGVVISVAMPAAVSLAYKPGVHRLIDYGDDDEGTARDIPPPVPVPRRVAVVEARHVPTPLAALSKPARLARWLGVGTGRHRARHISNVYSSGGGGSVGQPVVDLSFSQVGALWQAYLRAFDRPGGVAERVRELTRG